MRVNNQKEEILMEKRLSAGFGKVDITPDFPIGLGGYGGDAKRLWTEIAERIYATCIAVANGDTTLLMFTLDVLSAPVEFQRKIRVLIAKETGVPEDHIFFGAIHSHNAPSMYFAKVLDFVGEKCLEAAKTALSDLAPATLFAGKRPIEGMNFTRHYLAADGKKHSANTGIPEGTELVGHATKSDPDLTLIRFAREEKKDIVMVNFQAHCDSAYAIGFTNIAPSWAGNLRTRLEELAGVCAAYFTGTSGNQSQSSKIPSEQHHLDWKQYGKKMGEYAADILQKDLVPVEGTAIRTARTILDVERNTSDIHLYDDAMEVLALVNSGDKERAKALCKEKGLYGIGYCKGIKARKETDLGTYPEWLELQAFCIGDLGVVTNTNETFSDQGIFVKENTPFKHTFIITGNRGYLACREAYEYYAYEALGWSGYYVAGTAEKMADCWVDLLNKIH